MTTDLHSDSLSAWTIARWARRCADALAQRKAEINALNVFPVPDSDTGSNMAWTMAAAVASLDAMWAPDAPASPCPTTAQVAAALAAGAVRGARGNSGVVLSQLLRGLADAAAHGALDGFAVRDTLNQGFRFVTAAIADPVEGTVITVLRSAASAAAGRCQKPHPTAPTVIADAAHAARVALQRTRSQLPALRQAGVVDAGGYGLVILLDELAEVTGVSQVLTDGCDGHTGPHCDTATPHGPADLRPASATPHAVATESQLEVMCFLSDTDLDSVREFLAPLGDSIVLGPLTDTSAKVHIHTNRAGEVIEGLYARGTVTELTVEYLYAPGTAATTGTLVTTAATAAAGTRAATATSATTAANPTTTIPGTPATTATNPTTTIPSTPATPGGSVDEAADHPRASLRDTHATTHTPLPVRPQGERQRTVLALVPSAGAATFFGKAGADTLIVGGNDRDTTVALITRTITDLHVSEVILLTHGLVTRDDVRIIADRCTDYCTVMPVAASSLCAGIAALAVHDPALSLFEDCEFMADAAHTTVTIQSINGSVTVLRPRGAWAVTTHAYTPGGVPASGISGEPGATVDTDNATADTANAAADADNAAAATEDAAVDSDSATADTANAAADTDNRREPFERAAVIEANDVPASATAALDALAAILAREGELVTVFAESDALREGFEQAVFDMVHHHDVPEAVEFSFFTVPGCGADYLIGVE